MSDGLIIPQMPFYWRVSDEKSPPNIVPDQIPFHLDFRTDLNLLVQRTTPDLLGHLKRIYQAEANIGYLQDINTLAQPYGADLNRFIRAHLPQGRSRSLDILEIGCGGCTVLADLKNEGHHVTGVDPSPVAVKAAMEKEIFLVPDFFPPRSLKREFDFIFHSDVLEHVPDPITFLLDHKSFLKDGGTLLVSVPDCTESIKRGDISMVLHQHLNYFDEDSLRVTLEAADFEVIVIEKAKYGGSLYGLARIGTKKGEIKIHSEKKWEEFVKKAKSAVIKFQSFVTEAEKGGTSPLGFYVPLRVIPYLAFSKITGPIRIFDDTPHWHGKQIDGLPSVIENMSDLQKRPLSAVAIMSLTFDKAIQTKINEKLRTKINVKTLRDFL